MESKSGRLRWRGIVGFFDRLEDGLLSLILAVMIILAFAQIFLRIFFRTGVVWFSPFLRNLVLWVGLWGAAVATKDDKHINIDIVSRFLSERGRVGVRLITDSFATVVCILLAYSSYKLVRIEIEFHFKMAQLVLPWAYGIIALRFARNLPRRIAMLIRDETTNKTSTHKAG